MRRSAVSPVSAPNLFVRAHTSDRFHPEPEAKKSFWFPGLLASPGMPQFASNTPLPLEGGEELVTQLVRDTCPIDRPLVKRAPDLLMPTPLNQRISESLIKHDLIIDGLRYGASDCGQQTR